VAARLISAASSAAILLLVAGSAHARTDSEAGIWAEGSVRYAFVSGPYRYVDQAAPGYGFTGPVELEATLGGPGGEISGALGYAPSGRFAFGIGVDFMIAGGETPLGDYSILARAFHELFSMEGAIRPTGSGLLLRLGLGVERASFSSAGSDVGSYDNIYEPEWASGLGGHVGVGWTFDLFGFIANVGYARLEGPHSSYRPLSVGVGVLVQRW
jgi:hypothetical protein